MLVEKIIDLNAPLTPEQEARLDALEKMSDDDIVYDEDCPPLTDEQIKKIQQMYPDRRKLFENAEAV